MPPTAGPFLRVLVDGTAPGAWNMAVDETLLDGVGGGFTLRLYRWMGPTLSLGYAQPHERVDLAIAGRLGIGIVRRPTGGRAVLHADELTYALSGPSGDGPLAGGISGSYRRIAEGLRIGLQRLGAEVGIERSGSAAPPTAKGPCFGARTRFELVAAGRKLVGSAQRRRGGRLLQHGSILLGPPDPRLWAALGEGYREAAAASIGLTEVIGRRPGWRQLGAGLAAGMADALGLPLRRGDLTRDERRRARRLTARYRDPEWSRRR